MGPVNRKYTEWEAAFTVEAALVVPIVIGCLLFLILLSFRLHDYVVIRAAAAEIAAGGIAEEEINMIPPMFYYRNVTMETETEEGNKRTGQKEIYKASYQMQDTGLMESILKLIGNGTANSSFQMMGEAEYTYRNPVHFIWQCQMVRQDLEKGCESINGNSISEGTE